MNHKYCLNCDEPLAGKYCSNCGQRDRETEPSTTEWLRILWDDYIAMDKKLLRSIGHLFIPGKLTVEWLEGKQQSYIQPFRLYIFVVFLISGLTYILNQGESGQFISGILTGFLSAYTENHPELPTNFWFSFLIQVGQTTFVPLAAIAASIFNRNRSYIIHCVFCTHVWLACFCGIAFSGLSAATVSRFLNDSASEVISLLQLSLLLYIFVYIVLAARKVYQLSWIATLLRSIAFIPLAFLSWLLPIQLAVGLLF